MLAGARRARLSSAMSAAPTATAMASILRSPTPPAWVEDALAHWPELLIDHANCEKKAASTVAGASPIRRPTRRWCWDCRVWHARSCATTSR